LHFVSIDVCCAPCRCSAWCSYRNIYYVLLRLIASPTHKLSQPGMNNDDSALPTTYLGTLGGCSCSPAYGLSTEADLTSLRRLTGPSRRCGFIWSRLSKFGSLKSQHVRLRSSTKRAQSGSSPCRLNALIWPASDWRHCY
jgi:hypothetical protein